MHRQSVLCLALLTLAQTSIAMPFYAGIQYGYGSTTWGALIPVKPDEQRALTISTPISANEGGLIWGAFAGVELLPTLQIQFDYLRYRVADVDFDEDSLFNYYHHLQCLDTNTESMSLTAKVLMLIPASCVRLYSSFGGALVHRWDQITNTYRASPSFGFGINWNASQHTMAEIGANYTAGFGVSERDPADHYIPFLYSIMIKLGYRF